MPHDDQEGFNEVFREVYGRVHGVTPQQIFDDPEHTLQYIAWLEHHVLTMTKAGANASAALAHLSGIAGNMAQQVQLMQNLPDAPLDEEKKPTRH